MDGIGIPNPYKTHFRFGIFDILLSLTIAFIDCRMAWTGSSLLNVFQYHLLDKTSVFMVKSTSKYFKFHHNFLKEENK